MTMGREATQGRMQSGAKLREVSCPMLREWGVRCAGAGGGGGLGIRNSMTRYGILDRVWGMDVLSN